jgi:hypothetical protein
LGQWEHFKVPFEESTLSSQRFSAAGTETLGEAVVSEDSETLAGAPKNWL